MLDLDFLREYEQKEKSKINRKKFSASDEKYIKSADDLYPEIDKADGIVYPRGNVPLKLLLLLYNKIAVFVPPTNEEYFKKRYRMSFEDFLTLCRKGIILPIIAHPTDYVNVADKNAKFFEELFKLNPPSVWARGISLLDYLKIDFEIAKEKLPLNRIVTFKSVREQWRRHYPEISEQQLTNIITRELSTLYADLMIFGYEEVLDNLIKKNIRKSISEHQIVYYLKSLNELLTYPFLFGLGGTPVIDYEHTRQKFFYDFPINKVAEAVPEYITPNLQYVLEDFEIYLNDLSIRKLIEFHQKGYADDMRKAIRDLQNTEQNAVADESITFNTIYEKAEKVRLSLDEFHMRIGSEISSKIRDIERAEQTVNNQVLLSGVSFGHFLIADREGQNMDFSYLLKNQLPVSLLLPQDIQGLLTKKITEEFSPSIATLWGISKFLAK